MPQQLSTKFRKALSYAFDLHADQIKKASGVPYVGHLLSVAGTVLEHAGTETQAIAALLHDAAEDQGGRKTLNKIERKFGREVADIVEDCTDSWETPKPPWLNRKSAYIEHARHLSPPSLRVSAADKVHNSYAILRDLRNQGEKVWERFSAKPDDMISYYESLVRAFREAGGGRLVDELERIVRGIQREMGY